MNLKIGIDLTHIPEFERAVKRSGDIFLNRVFHPSELKRKDTPHLAGIFAAKEAIIKTSVLPLGSWKNIEVSYERNGRPKVEILGNNISNKIAWVDISISHEGDYATAIAMVQFKKRNDRL